MKLRPYQEIGLQDIKKFIDSDLDNGIYVSPVGTGKSILIAESVKLFKEPTLVLQPSKELLTQNYEKYTNYGFEASIYSSSLKSKQISDVTFATIGSIVGDLDSFKRFKNIIIDECHFASKEGNQLDIVIQKLGIKKVLGFTATPILMKNTMEGSYLQIMSRSRTCLFDNIIHVTQVEDILPYWSKIEYRISRDSDSKMLRLNSTGNDFTADSLKKFYDSNSIEFKILKSIDWLKSQGVNQSLIFVPTVDEAESLMKQVKGSEYLHGGTKPKDRERIVEGFKSGKIPYVFNVNVLGTGFDYPNLPSVIHGRPTGSLVVYYQHIGRIVRQGDKKCAYFLDLAGNVDRFGKIETFKFQEDKGKWDLYAGDKKITQNGFKPRRISQMEIDELEAEIRSYQLSFGKHRGKLLVNVVKEDKMYLKWLASDKFEPLTDGATRDKEAAKILLIKLNLI